MPPIHNEISIRMLKLCAISISKPLQILYNFFFDDEVYSCGNVQKKSGNCYGDQRIH